MDAELENRLIDFIKGLKHYDFKGVNNIHDVKKLCLVIKSYHNQKEMLSVGDYITLIYQNIGFNITDIEMNELAREMFEKIEFGYKVLEYTK